MMKKLFALITAGCFLFSSVLASAAEGAVDAVRTARLSVECQTALAAPAPSFALNLPASVGRISGSKDCGGDRLVVCIQDLHCHPEVQRNIAKILGSVEEYARASRGTGMQVYVEGGYGGIDTSWLSAIKDTGTRRQVMEGLLEAGRLTGAEYYSMTTGRYHLLQGLEDEKLHKANVVRLEQLLEKKPQFEEKLKEMSRDLEYMKARHFTSKNKQFNRLLAKYREGKIDAAHYYACLGRYIEQVNTHPEDFNNLGSLNLDNYPDIRTHRELLEMQKRLPYSRIARQLQAFMQTLKAKLPYSVYRQLMERTGNLSKLDMLYAELPELAKECRLDLDRQHPDLQLFAAYIEKNRSLNPVALVKEEKRLIEDLRVAFSKDNAELEISFLTDFFGTFEDYLTTRLSADDYEYFKSRIDKFRTIWGKYAFRNQMPDLAADMPLLDKYYAVNDRRNGIFLENIENGGKGIDVVVAGGFHTEGLTRLLEEQRISYLTITPNVTTGTDQCDAVYREIAARQAKLFSSQALALALGSSVAKVLQATGRRIELEVNDEKIEFTWNEKTQRFAYADNGKQRTSEGEKFPTRKALASGVNRAVRIAADIRSLENPMATSRLIFELVQHFSVWSARRGIFGGDGLIWAVATDDEVKRKIGKYEDIDPADLAILSEYMQELTVADAALKDRIAAIAQRSPLVAAINNVPGMQLFIDALYREQYASGDEGKASQEIDAAPFTDAAMERLGQSKIDPSLLPKARMALEALRRLNIYDENGAEDAVEFLDLVMRHEADAALDTLLLLLGSGAVTMDSFPYIRELYDNVQQKYAAEFSSARGDVFQALQAFVSNKIIAVDNLKAVNKLFIPQQYSTHRGEVAFKGEDLQYFQALKRFAEKGIVSADNLQLADAVFIDLLAGNPRLHQKTGGIAAKFSDLAERGLVRKDNLFILAAVLYAASLSRNENAATLLQSSELDAILNKPSAYIDSAVLFGDKTNRSNGEIARLIYAYSLQMDTQDKKNAVVRFYQNYGARRILLEQYETIAQRFEEAHAASLLNDYVRLAVTAGYAGDQVLHRYNYFVKYLNDDIRKRPENVREYLETLGYVFRQVEQQMLTAKGRILSGKVNKNALVFHFLTHMYEPLRLKAIFDIYFNPLSDLQKFMGQYRSEYIAEHPEASYEIQDDAMMELHRSQMRKLGYNYFSAFFLDFVNDKSEVAPEGELFFKLFTMKTMTRHKIRNRMQGKLDVMNYGLTEGERILFQKLLRLVDRKVTQKKPVKKEDSGQNKQVIAVQGLNKILNLAINYALLQHRGKTPKTFGMKRELIKKIDEVLAAGNDEEYKVKADALEAFIAAFNESFRNEQFAVLQHLLETKLGEKLPVEEVKLLSEYSSALPVNQYGKNLFESMKEFVTNQGDSNKDVVRVMYQALLQEAGGSFKAWRYRSNEYIKMMNEYVSAASNKSAAWRRVKKIDALWKENRYYSFNDGDSAYYLGFTDDYATLMNLGTPDEFDSCINTDEVTKNAWGLAGYVANGSNKALVVFDDKGQLVARRIVRLRYTADNQFVLLQEKHYGETKFAGDFDRLFTSIASEMKVPYQQSEINGKPVSGEKAEPLRIELNYWGGNSAWDKYDILENRPEVKVDQGLMELGPQAQRIIALEIPLMKPVITSMGQEYEPSDEVEFRQISSGVTVDTDPNDTQTAAAMMTGQGTLDNYLEAHPRIKAIYDFGEAGGWRRWPRAPIIAWIMLSLGRWGAVRAEKTVIMGALGDAALEEEFLEGHRTDPYTGELLPEKAWHRKKAALKEGLDSMRRAAAAAERIFMPLALYGLPQVQEAAIQAAVGLNHLSYNLSSIIKVIFDRLVPGQFSGSRFPAGSHAAMTSGGSGKTHEAGQNRSNAVSMAETAPATNVAIADELLKRQIGKKNEHLSPRIREAMVLLIDLGIFDGDHKIEARKFMKMVLKESPENALDTLLLLLRSGAVDKTNFTEVQELFDSIQMTDRVASAREDAFNAVRAFIQANIITKGNLSMAHRLFVPVVESYLEDEPGKYDNYYKALQLLAAKNIAGVENLELLTIMFSEMMANSDSTGPMTAKTIDLVNADLVNRENLFQLATLIYIALLMRREYGGIPEFLTHFEEIVKSPETYDLKKLFPGKRKSGKEDQQWEVVLTNLRGEAAALVYRQSLAATTQSQKDTLLAFYGSTFHYAILNYFFGVSELKEDNKNTTWVWDYLTMAMNAGAAAKDLLVNRGAFLDKNDGRVWQGSSISSIRASLPVFSHIVYHVQRQRQGRGVDIPDEDEQNTMIFEMIRHLFERQYDPVRLKAIFDVYFNADDDEARKNIETFQIKNGEGANIAAFYNSMDEASKRLHKEQKRKLDYRFFVPFMNNFVNERTELSPEAELFFKAFTTREMNDGSSGKALKVIMGDTLKALAKNGKDKSAARFRNVLNVLAKKVDIRKDGSRKMAETILSFTDLLLNLFTLQHREGAEEDPVSVSRQKVFGALAEAFAVSGNDFENAYQNLQNSIEDFKRAYVNEQKERVWESFEELIETHETRKEWMAQAAYAGTVIIDKAGTTLFQLMEEHKRGQRSEAEVLSVIETVLKTDKSGKISFWQEHPDNFKIVLEDYLDKKQLLSLAEYAGGLSIDPSGTTLLDVMEEHELDSRTGAEVRTAIRKAFDADTSGRLKGWRKKPIKFRMLFEDSLHRKHRADLDAYVAKLPVDAAGKSLIDTLVEYLQGQKYRDETIEVVYRALIAEITGRFGWWRNRSQDFTEMFKEYLRPEKTEVNKRDVSDREGKMELKTKPEKAKRIRENWKKNRYYSITDKEGDIYYIGFTDLFPTMINLGNVFRDYSCQATDQERPKYSHGLMGYVANGSNKALVVYDEDGNLVSRRLARLKYTRNDEFIVMREKTYGDKQFNDTFDSLLNMVAHDMGVRYQPDNGGTVEKIVLRLWGGHSMWDYSDTYGGIGGEEAGLVRLKPGKHTTVKVTIPLAAATIEKMDESYKTVDELLFRQIAGKDNSASARASPPAQIGLVATTASTVENYLTAHPGVKAWYDDPEHRWKRWFAVSWVALSPESLGAARAEKEVLARAIRNGGGKAFIEGHRNDAYTGTGLGKLSWFFKRAALSAGYAFMWTVGRSVLLLPLGGWARERAFIGSIIITHWLYNLVAVTVSTVLYGVSLSLVKLNLLMTVDGKTAAGRENAGSRKLTVKTAPSQLLENTAKAAGAFSPFVRKSIKALTEENDLKAMIVHAELLGKAKALGFMDREFTLNDDETARILYLITNRHYDEDNYALYTALLDSLKENHLIRDISAPDGVVEYLLNESRDEEDGAKALSTLVYLMDKGFIDDDALLRYNIEGVLRQLVGSSWNHEMYLIYLRGLLVLQRRGLLKNDAVLLGKWGEEEQDTAFKELFTYYNHPNSLVRNEEIGRKLDVLTLLAENGFLTPGKLASVNYFDRMKEYRGNERLFSRVIDFLEAAALHGAITKQDFERLEVPAAVLPGLSHHVARRRIATARRLVAFRDAGLLSSLRLDRDTIEDMIDGGKLNWSFEGRNDKSIAESWEALRILIENDMLDRGDGTDAMVEEIAAKGLEYLDDHYMSPDLAFAAAGMFAALKRKGYIEFATIEKRKVLRLLPNRGERRKSIPYNQEKLNRDLLYGLRYSLADDQNRKLTTTRTLWTLLDIGMVARRSVSRPEQYLLFSWLDSPVVRNAVTAVADTLSAMQGEMRILSDKEVDMLYEEVALMPAVKDRKTAEKAEHVFAAAVFRHGVPIVGRTFDIVRAFVDGLPGTDGTGAGIMRALLHTVDLLSAYGSRDAREFALRTLNPASITARTDDMVESIQWPYSEPPVARAKEAVELLYALKIATAENKGDIHNFLQMVVSEAPEESLETLVSILRSGAVTSGNYAQVREIYENIQEKYSDKYMMSREDAFRALKAFADADIIRKDNLPVVSRLFTPEHYTTYQEDYRDRGRRYFYFPALRAFAENGVITADNLELATVLFTDLIDSNELLEGYTDSITHNFKELAEKKVIRADNLFRLATLTYMASFVSHWTLLIYETEAFLTEPDALITGRKYLVYREIGHLNAVVSALYEHSLSADTPARQKAAMAFYRNRNAQKFVLEKASEMEKRFERAQLAPVLKDYLAFAMDAGPAGERVLSGYDSFLDLSADRRETAADAGAYIRTLSHILLQAQQPQPQTKAVDMPDAEGLSTMVRYFLQRYYEPARLADLFNVYFNSSDRKAHKAMAEKAFYGSMAPAYRKVHERQDRKLDYNFLVPFMINFVTDEGRVLMEGEIFFKLFTSRELHASRDMKNMMRFTLVMLGAVTDAREQLRKMVELVGREHDIANVSMNQLDKRDKEYDNRNRSFVIAGEIVELATLIKNLAAVREKEDGTPDPDAVIKKQAVLQKLDEALAAADAGRFKEKNGEFTAAVQEFNGMFRNGLLGVLSNHFRSILGEETLTAAVSDALLEYAGRQPVDYEGKNVFDIIFDYVQGQKSRPEIVNAIYNALVAEAQHRFTAFRYSSKEYTNMFKAFKQLRAVVEKEEVTDAKIKKMRAQWQKNRYYRFQNSADENYYLGFTDNFATLLNLGNPREFHSCQATNNPAYNHGLSGYVANGSNKALAVYDGNGKMIARRVVRLRYTDNGEIVALHEPTYGEKQYDAVFDSLLGTVALDMGIRYEPNGGGNAIPITIGLWSGNSEWDYSDTYAHQLGLADGLIHLEANDLVKVHLSVPLREAPAESLGTRYKDLQEAEFKYIVDKIVSLDNGDGLASFAAATRSATIDGYMTAHPGVRAWYDDPEHRWKRWFAVSWVALSPESLGAARAEKEVLARAIRNGGGKAFIEGHRNDAYAGTGLGELSWFFKRAALSAGYAFMWTVGRSVLLLPLGGWARERAFIGSIIIAHWLYNLVAVTVSTVLYGVSLSLVKLNLLMTTGEGQKERSRLSMVNRLLEQRLMNEIERASGSLYGEKEDAVAAFQAFIDRGMVQPDTEADIRMLFVPGRSAGNSIFAARSRKGYRYFPALKVFAEKGIITPGNLAMVVTLYVDLIDGGRQLPASKYLIAERLESLTEKGLIHSDNLMQLVTMVYLAFLNGKGHFKEIIQNDSFEKLLGDPRSSADFEKLFGGEMKGLNEKIFRNGLSAHSREQRQQLLTFYANSNAARFMEDNYLTLRQQFDQLGAPALLDDVVEIAILADPEGTNVLSPRIIDHFAGAVRSAGVQPEKAAAYLRVVGGILREIRREQEQAGETDLSVENYAQIKYLLSHYHDPERLKSLFDSYFYRDPHRQQAQKLDYDYLLPFLIHFTDKDTLVLPEAELFFRVFSLEEVKKSRRVKRLMSAGFNLLALDPVDEQKLLFKNMMGYLGRKWATANGNADNTIAVAEDMADKSEVVFDIVHGRPMQEGQEIVRAVKEAENAKGKDFRPMSVQLEDAVKRFKNAEKTYREADRAGEFRIMHLDVIDGRKILNGRMDVDIAELHRSVGWSYQDSIVLSQFEDPRYSSYIAINREGKIAGYILMTIEGADEHNALLQGHVSYGAVHADHQGKKIGKRLQNSVINELQNRGIVELHYTYKHGTPQAQFHESWKKQFQYREKRNGDNVEIVFEIPAAKPGKYTFERLQANERWSQAKAIAELNTAIGWPAMYKEPVKAKLFDSRNIVIVARGQDRELIGYIIVEPERFMEKLGKQTAYFPYLAVNEHYRNKGIATGLIRSAVAELKKQGKTELAANYHALRDERGLYEALKNIYGVLKEIPDGYYEADGGPSTLIVYDVAQEKVTAGSTMVATGNGGSKDDGRSKEVSIVHFNDSSEREELLGRLKSDIKALNGSIGWTILDNLIVDYLKDPKYDNVVALNNGHIIGYAIVRQAGSYGTNGNRTGSVPYIAVHKDFQKSAIGERMVEAIFKKGNVDELEFTYHPDGIREKFYGRFKEKYRSYETDEGPNTRITYSIDSGKVSEENGAGVETGQEKGTGAPAGAVVTQSQTTASGADEGKKDAGKYRITRLETTKGRRQLKEEIGSAVERLHGTIGWGYRDGPVKSALRNPAYSSLFAVNENDDGVIGYIVYRIVKDEAGSDMGHVYFLAVDNTRQGEKIGKTLVFSVIDELKAKGINRIRFYYEAGHAEEDFYQALKKYYPSHEEQREVFKEIVYDISGERKDRPQTIASSFEKEAAQNIPAAPRNDESGSRDLNSYEAAVMNAFDLLKKVLDGLESTFVQTAREVKGLLSHRASGRDEEGATFLDWHYLAPGALRAAAGAFGTAITDPNGDMHAGIYVLDREPEDMAAWGWEPTGIKIDEKKTVWASTKAGVVVLYAEGVQPERIAAVVNGALLTKGRLAGSRKGIERFKTLFDKVAGDTIRLKDAGFKPGIVIDHTAAEAQRSYNASGNIVVPAGYFAAEGRPGQETIAARYGELMHERHTDAVAMAQSFFVRLDGIKGIDAFKANLDAFLLTGNMQMIASPEAFAGVSDRVLREITGLAAASGVKIYIEPENTEPATLAGYRGKGFAGYARSGTGTVMVYDYLSDTAGIEADDIQGYTGPESLNDRLQASRRPYKVLNLSELKNLMEGGQRDILDRVALTGMLKNAILSFYNGTTLTPAYAERAGEAWGRDRLPPLPDTLQELKAAVRSGKPDELIAAMKLKGIDHPVNRYLGRLAVADRDTAAQLQQAYLTAIAGRMLARAALDAAGKQQGLADPELEIILGRKLVQQLRENTADKGIDDSFLQLEKAKDSGTTEKFYERLKDTVRELNGRRADPKAVNTIIQLIPLYAEQRTGIRVEEHRMNFDTGAVNKLLSAA